MKTTGKEVEEHYNKQCTCNKRYIIKKERKVPFFHDNKGESGYFFPVSAHTNISCDRAPRAMNTFLVW